MTARALILAERQTLQGTKAAVDEGVDQAVAAVSRHPSANKAALLAAVVVAAQAMRRKSHSALVEGRQHARRKGAKRLAVELAALGLWLVPHAQAASIRRVSEDDLRSSAAADSLAGAWQAAAFAAVSTAILREADVARAVEATRADMKYRVIRTAATETSQAFNEERRELVRESLADDSSLATAARGGGGFFRVWDAMLDQRTCARCSGHDGETVGPGEPFSGGDEPGEVHPICRCIVTYIVR